MRRLTPVSWHAVEAKIKLEKRNKPKISTSITKSNVAILVEKMIGAKILLLHTCCLGFDLQMQFLRN